MRRLVLMALPLLLACEPERDRSPSGTSSRSDATVRLDASPSDGSSPSDGASGLDVAPGFDGGFFDGGFTDGGFSDGGFIVDAAPTDTGTPPGPTGLEHFCMRYFECGGTYYANPQDCVSQSLGYWGTCAGRRAALDAFSDCMAAIPCTDYNPNAYNPANTPCAPLWTALQQTPPC